MKRPLLYISSFFILGLTWGQTLADMPAQDTLKQDTLIANPVVPKEPAQPFSISFLIDYGKSAVSLFSDEQRYEGGLNLLFFDHYSIIGEYGYGSLHPRNALQNGNYYSEGNYFRVGGGYLNTIGPKSKLGFSVRYGQSTFKDRGEIFVESASGIQEGYETTFGPRSSEARWIELVVTSESRIIFNKENQDARINHLFSLGFHIRLRFMSSYDRYLIYDTYAVPGYGRTVNNPNPAVNVYLRFTPF